MGVGVVCVGVGGWWVGVGVGGGGKRAVEKAIVDAMLAGCIGRQAGRQDRAPKPQPGRRGGGGQQRRRRRQRRSPLSTTRTLSPSLFLLTHW